MIEAAVIVHFSDALLQDISSAANQSGISIEDWLRESAAERLRDQLVTERFFSKSTQMSKEESGKVMLDILALTKDNPPMPGDEI